MARPIIGFVTDFGTQDHYVGAMKGVALAICPDATLVDITHAVPPQDVLTGALELAAAWKYFPAGSVFVAVVDPGVGSARRGLAAAAGDCWFVAPDNGLLTAVFDDSPPAQVVELTNPAYARPVVSRTFEGRDRFAPAAAWLASGVALPALGAPLAAWQRLEIPRPQRTGAAVTGVVLRVDRFGNLISNIDRRTVEGLSGAGVAVVTAGGRDVGALVGTYAEAGEAPCALFGSSDFLEIAVNGGSAAARLGLARGAAIVVTRR